MYINAFKKADKDGGIIRFKLLFLTDKLSFKDLLTYMATDNNTLIN